MKRKILDINVRDRIHNAKMRRRSGLDDAALTVQRLKWQWGCYVTRMKQDRWAYTVMVTRVKVSGGTQ